jgi:hypothetical protein
MIEQRDYLLSQAAEAVGVSLNTLRAWVQRGHIRLTERPMNGLARPVSSEDVKRIAIMAALVGEGVPAQTAWSATRAFLDFAPGPLGGEQARNPGDLFPEGETVLVAYADDPQGYVFSVRKPEDWQRVRYPIGLSTNRKSAGKFVVVNDVLRALRARLA